MARIFYPKFSPYLKPEKGKRGCNLTSDGTAGYSSHTIKQISQNSCTIITPELEGFRRPNWAQIKADLCVSNMGGLVLNLTTGWPRSDVVVGFTSGYNTHYEYINLFSLN